MVSESETSKGGWQMAELLRPWRSGIVAALAVTAIFAFVACGDDEEGVGETVSVELSEFDVVVGRVSVPQGNVIFRAENVGDFEHELVVIRTDLAPDALPLAEEGGIDESQVEVAGRTDRFEPGSATASFDLEPGNYVLACNIVFVPEEGEPVSHYENGMRAALMVME